MAEMDSHCKKEERKWALAEFEEMFVTPVVRRRVVTPVTVPEEVAPVVPVMAEVTEEVVDTPQVLEPQVQACTVRLQPVHVPVESTDVSAPASTSSVLALTSTSATVCNSAAPVEYSDTDSSTSWSDTTRQVLDNVLVRFVPLPRGSIESTGTST